jgi:hypothetical protein
MSAQFWPCPGCSRHIKRGDAVCPFCGAAASVESGPTRVLAGRLSRAALFAAGAVGAAVATTDCGTTAVPAYGFGPYFPSETDDASASDTAISEAEAEAADASTEPIDSSSADDVPSSQPPGPTYMPAYGAFMPPSDE